MDFVSALVMIGSYFQPASTDHQLLPAPATRSTAVSPVGHIDR